MKRNINRFGASLMAAMLITSVGITTVFAQEDSQTVDNTTPAIHSMRADFANMTDAEKTEMKAQREAQRAERIAKFANMTDAEKAEMKAEREAMKAKFESMTDAEKAELKANRPANAPGMGMGRGEMKGQRVAGGK